MITMQVVFTEEQFRYLSKLAKRRKKGLVEMLVDEAMKLSPEEKLADKNENEDSAPQIADVVVAAEEAATGGVSTVGEEKVPHGYAVREAAKTKDDTSPHGQDVREVAKKK